MDGTPDLDSSFAQLFIEKKHEIFPRRLRGSAIPPRQRSQLGIEKATEIMSDLNHLAKKAYPVGSHEVIHRLDHYKGFWKVCVNNMLESSCEKTSLVLWRTCLQNYSFG